LFMIDHITSATTGNTHPLPDSLPICERNDCRALFIRLTGKTDGANLITPVIIHKKRIFFAEIDQLIHLISLWAIDPESIRTQLLHVSPKQSRQKAAETTAEAVDAGIEIGCGIHRHLKIMRRKHGLCGVEGVDTCREKLLIKIILTNFGLTLI